MIRIVLSGVAPDFEQRFAQVTGNSCLSLPRPKAGGAAALMNLLEGLPAPDLVVLDARADPTAALDLSRELTRDYPISVLLIASQPEAMGLAAMRSGVSDVIGPNADVDEIRRSIESTMPNGARRAEGWTPAPADTAPPRPTGRVITFASPKGGVGKTLTSTNLAVALAQAAPDSTVLVDLDLPFGDVATALNLSHEFSVADAVDGPASRDAMVLKTYLARHASGLYALPAPDHPAAAEKITAEQIRNLLEMLATEFAYVVVDTSPGLTDQTLGALDATTDLVLLTALSVPGVRGLRKVIDTLNALKMFSARRQVIINFADSGGGMSKADVEATLGGPVGATLPRSKAALASINVGIPLMQSAKRDPLVKALRRLAGVFMGEKVRAR